MERYKLLADSGATKSEWALLGNGGVLEHFYTSGINVTYSSEEDIKQIVNIVVSRLSITPDQLNELIFYGAGCANEYKTIHLKTILFHHFPNTNIRIYSDLIGACHALCGTNPGWVAILGTGSASCLYDGQQMTIATPSPGYLLGDEGSGTSLGKKLLKAYLMNQMSTELKKDFENKYQLSPTLVLEKLYRQPNPNRFMSSFAPYMMEQIENPFIHKICAQNFQEFIQLNLDYYPDYKKYKLNILGSIAYHFRALITQVAAQNSIEMGLIEAAPMPRLIKQYLNANLK